MNNQTTKPTEHTKRLHNHELKHGREDGIAKGEAKEMSAAARGRQGGGGSVCKEKRGCEQEHASWPTPSASLRHKQQNSLG